MKKETTSYLVRELPKELLTKAKHRAIDEETTVRLLIIKALTEYLDK